jgi:MFS family permease
MASSLIVKNLFMPIWGKASDRFGTKKVLTLSSYLISLVPILWLFSSNFFYLLVIQFYNGFVWAGFELSAFNFIFDTTAPRKRITSIGYYNFLNGIGIFIGGILGSILVKFHLIFWSAYLFTFLLSGILRLGLAAIFTPRLKEARPVEQISYRRLFTHVLTDIPGPRSIYMSMPFRKNKGRNCQEDVSEWD